MASAYLSQMAPASTISNCATYQTADSLRWLTHTAYRTKELSKTFPDIGLGQAERALWEQDAAWQGWRELIEKALIAWDWAESFTAFNLVIRPAVEEAVLRAWGEVGRRNGDTLLGLLTDAQWVDVQRHRRWASALVQMMLTQPNNHAVLTEWVKRWEPLADQAIAAYCAAQPDLADVTDRVQAATRTFRRGVGL